MHRVKEAKEQLGILLRMIDEREAMSEASLPESQVLGLVEEVKGYRVAYNIDINIYDQVIKDMRKLVNDDLSLGDRSTILSRINSKLAAAGVPEAERKHLISELAIAATEKNDTKLNQALSYVEELVGNNAAGTGVGAVNTMTRELTDWCKNIGDWDQMKGLLGAKENNG